MTHCNACGADADTSTEPGWTRFELGGMDVSSAGTQRAAIVPAITMTACPQHGATVLAQFNRQRAQRELWLRSWLDRNIPTTIEAIA
jgi:hypothetical protein